jgi:hypothetical protein
MISIFGRGQTGFDISRPAIMGAFLHEFCPMRGGGFFWKNRPGASSGLVARFVATFSQR